MVQTARLCDPEACPEDPPSDGSTYCKGWDVQGGIEVRCTNEVHRERTVSTEATALALGITYRRLDLWISRGWVRVENPHPGSGHARNLTQYEAAVARLLAVLTKGGVHPATAARLARNLWDGEEARLTDALVVTWRQEGSA